MTVHFSGPTQVKQHLGLAARAALQEALYFELEKTQNIPDNTQMEYEGLILLRAHLQAALMDEAAPDFLEQPASYLQDSPDLYCAGDRIETRTIDLFTPGSRVHRKDPLVADPTDLTPEIIRKAAAIFISQLACMVAKPRDEAHVSMPHEQKRLPERKDEFNRVFGYMTSLLDCLEKAASAPLKRPFTEDKSLRDHLYCIIRNSGF